ncbi:MAG: alpha/beta fold hydrolase, partial [Roseiflexaceae bacterium]
RFEDLTDVILVGYSYSGMVTTAVPDRLPERLAHLIYVDAYVPNDGQSLADILGPQVMTMLREIADQYGDGWRLPHNPPDAPFRTDQPLNTAFQAIHLQDPRALAILRSLIFCTEKDPADPIMAPIAHAAAHAKADPSWRYHELPTGHVPWETMPQALARLLHECAQPSISAA